MPRYWTHGGGRFLSRAHIFGFLLQLLLAFFFLDASSSFNPQLYIAA